MCIRDSLRVGHRQPQPARLQRPQDRARRPHPARRGDPGPCLLYTSDAADERSSVDLGGRRIIKKKKKYKQSKQSKVQ